MKYLIILLCGIIGLMSDLSAQSRCVIRGELSGLPTDEVQIVKATLDYRYHGAYAAVKQGKFEFVLETEVPEAYKLIFVTSSPRKWYTYFFFPDTDKINFTIDSAGTCKISGSPLNLLYQQFRSEEQQGFSTYSQKLKDSVIQNKCTPAVKRKLMNLLSDLGKQKENYVREYFSGKRNEVFYYWLIEELKKTKENREELGEELFTDYQEMAKLYPQHPYTDLGKTLINGLNTIKPGGKYVEFIAPDLNGNLINITDKIRGKIALIDLWASWCIPCRTKAKAMIPIYEKYKDKGFEIVGIAREFKNTEKMKEAITKDKYPWLQLVELNDQNQIWTRYMLGNAGGGVFLVDPNGTILSVNPTPQEVEAELVKRFGK